MIKIDKFATVAGAAKKARVSTSALRGALDAGRVVSHRLGDGSVVVEVADAMVYAQNRPKRGLGAEEVVPRRPLPEVAEFWTVGGAAEEVGLHRNSLWNLLAAGRVPTHQLACGSKLVRVDEIRAYQDAIHNKAEDTTPEPVLRLNTRASARDLAKIVASTAVTKVRPYREVNGELERCTIDVFVDGDEVKLIVKE